MKKNLSNTQQYAQDEKDCSPSSLWLRIIQELLDKYVESLTVQEDLCKKIAEIQRSLVTDDITGLMNRSAFIHCLDQFFSSVPTATSYVVSMIKIDIDNFRSINTMFGSCAADHVLQEVAKIIDKAVKQVKDCSMFCGRVGADEIEIFMPNVNLSNAHKIAEKIRRSIEDNRYGYKEFRVTASCGVVCIPQRATTREDLMSKADAATHSAKLLGHNRCYVFENDLSNHQIHMQTQQKELILNALEHDRFEIWLQPILDLRNGTVHHYEALLRLRADDGQIYLPSDFIDTAEHFGLISYLDRIAATKAITMQSELERIGKDIHFSCNISGRNFDDPDFLRFLQTEIVSARIRPQRMIFEITETAAIRDFKQALCFIEQLKKIGCLFSLDDFGVGFTSFHYLRQLPLDYVKIDGMFIRSLHIDKVNQALVKAIVDIANVMGLKTIAECVEQQETLHFLYQLGVHYAQGFLIGIPDVQLQRD